MFKSLDMQDFLNPIHDQSDSMKYVMLVKGPML